MVPVLGTLNHRCRIILETQKGTIILTTTLVAVLTRTGVQGALTRTENSGLDRLGIGRVRKPNP